MSYRLNQVSAAMMDVLDTEVTLVNGRDEALPIFETQAIHQPCKATLAPVAKTVIWGPWCVMTRSRATFSASSPANLQL